MTFRFNLRPFGFAAILLSALGIASPSARAQGSSLGSFTYQGRLNDASGPANGVFDFQFSLYSSSTGPGQIDTTITSLFLPVTNGLFTVQLSFPMANSSFNGSDRWLEIAVKAGGVATNYIVLSPRQQITSAPYAIRAGSAASAATAQNVSGPVPATQITGTISTANLPPINNGAPPLAPGGIVMSDDPTNAALAAQGYARIPNAELTLSAEGWIKKKSPVPNTEFLPLAGDELSLDTGSELLVFGFERPPGGFPGNQGPGIARLLRYNPTTGRWTKGATPPGGCGPTATVVWTGTHALLYGGQYGYLTTGPFGGSSYSYVHYDRVLAYSPALDQWTTFNETGAIPAGRDLHTAIWTGSRMLIWGGQAWGQGQVGPELFDLNTGASFDPATGIWTAITANGAPGNRRGHVAVWTGTQMIVQGGTVDNRNPSAYSTNNVFKDGARYNPATDTWSSIQTNGAAPQVAFANAVWTGAEMFVIGGYSYFPGASSGKPVPGSYSYHPANNVWTDRGVYDLPSDPIVSRANCGISWTGADVLVWGGEGGSPGNSLLTAVRNDGHAYNFGTGTWRPLAAVPVGVAPALSPKVAWLSNQWVVLAGTNCAAYRPGNNSWSLLNSFIGSLPANPADPSVLWTGKELIVWGGLDNGTPSNRGRRYNPATDTWTELNTTNAPAARARHSAVWTGTRMVVWGGDGGGDPLYPTVVHAGGSAYDPVTDTWTAIPTPPVDPQTGDTFRRTGHQAVWTAYGMVVVGGSDGYNNQGQDFNPTMARLSPNLGSWTLKTGVGRFEHCLATDGNRRVFLWGGRDQVDADPIGNGTYLIDAVNLSADELDSADQPEPSRNPTVVWSGKEFIVWGGSWTDGTPFGGGSKFNPDSAFLSWTPLSVGGPALTTRHAGHTTVWSGTEMLIWGGTTNAFGARYNPRNDAWTPMSVGPTMRTGGKAVWSGTNMLLYLPALPTSGAIPELWQYQPPAKTYLYLKL